MASSWATPVPRSILLFGQITQHIARCGQRLEVIQSPEKTQEEHAKAVRANLAEAWRRIFQSEDSSVRLELQRDIQAYAAELERLETGYRSAQIEAEYKRQANAVVEVCFKDIIRLINGAGDICQNDSTDADRDALIETAQNVRERTTIFYHLLRPLIMPVITQKEKLLGCLRRPRNSEKSQEIDGLRGRLSEWQRSYKTSYHSMARRSGPLVYHAMKSSDYNLLFELFGIEVLGCNKSLAEKNNTAAREASKSENGGPQKTASRRRKEHSVAIELSTIEQTRSPGSPASIREAPTSPRSDGTSVSTTLVDNAPQTEGDTLSTHRDRDLGVATSSGSDEPSNGEFVGFIGNSHETSPSRPDAARIAPVAWDLIQESTSTTEQTSIKAAAQTWQPEGVFQINTNPVLRQLPPIRPLLEGLSSWRAEVKAVSSQDNAWLTRFPRPLADELRRRSKSTTREPQPNDFVNPQGDFQCPFCGKAIARLTTFNKHLKGGCRDIRSLSQNAIIRPKPSKTTLCMYPFSYDPGT
ncbi:Fc.00g056250.m01.CDS01 [Cosmosporella sp. VM-42]